MMTVTRDKNLIIVHYDEVERTIDINRGEIYGKNNKKVKTLGFPYAFFRNYLRIQNQLENGLLSFISNIGFFEDFERLLKNGSLNFLDKIEHLPYKIEITNSTIVFFSEQNELALSVLKNKKYLQWLEKSDLPIVNMGTFRRFCTVETALNFKNKYPLNENEYDSIVKLIESFPDENTLDFLPIIYWYVFHYLRNPAIKNHMLYNHKTKQVYVRDFYDKSDIAIPSCYITMCKALGRDLATTDFYRDKAIVEDLYYNKLLTEQTLLFKSRYSDVYLFSTDKYKIVLPETGEDLIEEGRKLQHCVGSYVESVCKGADAIVFVRECSNPDEPYITCQILPDASILQYYKKNDSYITSEDEFNFKSEYQAHLTAHKQEIAKLFE